MDDCNRCSKLCLRHVSCFLVFLSRSSAQKSWGPEIGGNGYATNKIFGLAINSEGFLFAGTYTTLFRSPPTVDSA